MHWHSYSELPFVIEAEAVWLQGEQDEPKRSAGSTPFAFCTAIVFMHCKTGRMPITLATPSDTAFSKAMP